MAYSTTDGQTKKIIERIKIELAGSDVETAPISRANELELTAFELFAILEEFLIPFLLFIINL